MHREPAIMSDRSQPIPPRRADRIAEFVRMRSSAKVRYLSLVAQARHQAREIFNPFDDALKIAVHGVEFASIDANASPAN